MSSLSVSSSGHRFQRSRNHLWGNSAGFICLLLLQWKQLKTKEEDEARVIGESKGKPQYDVVVVTGLPELSLERILDRLSPASLCAMVGVCFALRDRCRSDHFWEKHMKQKWGKVVGDAADRE
ncbi:hypothetical protein V6N12_045117 [Hibiscus sabdariffa]|uniref:F-box domain-containing protein n=1 Tax=Hibiscus sabdariffa TaxID=183260 RepID=A0ABR2G223_9ROSI